MAWLQAYRDEHSRYPREQRIKLVPRLAELTTIALAKSFGLSVFVHMNSRTVGKCWGATIQLPAEGCSLGMVLHELAHAYDRQRYNHRGHTGTFKNALGIIYHQGRPLFKKILLDAYNQMQRERQEACERSQKLAEKVQREATKRAAARVERKSPAYKMEKLRVRIKRLETRIKRMSTILRGAKRSLGIYERLAAKIEIREEIH